MAMIISQIRSPLSSTPEEIIRLGLKKAGISPAGAREAAVHKTSLDARKQDRICLVSSVFVRLEPEREAALCGKLPFCAAVEETEIQFTPGKEKLDGRPVIAGFGPAGMFAALTLAEYGYRPLVLERGRDMDSRVERVRSFWRGGPLDPESNVQFGEGGAGTFSDGKLTTRIKDPFCAHILKKLVEFGAPPEILTQAKPHIGTDLLRDVVKNLRERVLELGGEIRFQEPMLDFVTESGRLTSLMTPQGSVAAGVLILAVGHSARDTFQMLLKRGILMEPKPFSVGARIEHPQEAVNASLYGVHTGNPLLPQGEYQLSWRQGGRAVYTFCMCPGGFVVPAASEEGGVVTNGMSEHARNQPNANSALVVSVSPEDFPSGPLGGMMFAQEIERRAYQMGIGQGAPPYTAPAVSVGAFLEGKTGISSQGVQPSYALGTAPGDFDKLLPSPIPEWMRKGIRLFSRQLSCFGDPEAVLTGPETRTSSPVRIPRENSLYSRSLSNLIPCGEGAGYAGGIVSAAVDGMRAAQAVITRYSPDAK